MRKHRYIILLLHTITILTYLLYHTYSQVAMLIAPFLHAMIIRADSACYPNHCPRKSPRKR